MMYDNLYCKIFVDTDMSYSELYIIIKEYLAGEKIALTCITSEWCNADVIKNKEYISGSDDFLYWKYFLDVNPNNNIEENKYIHCTAQLLSFLKERFNNAVAACDFEDRLISPIISY